MRLNVRRLRQLRETSGLTQAALAAKVGVSARTIRHSEQGKHAPQLSNLRAIAEALGVSLEALAEDDLEPDSAVVASVTQGRAPAMPRWLLGRDVWLDRIRKQLGDTDSPRLLAIHGWPGVGKTTLMAALAHDPALSRRFADGVLWCSLGPDADVRAVLCGWMSALGLSLHPVAEPTPHELAERIGFALREKSVLVLVDDAWSAAAVELLRVVGIRGAMVVSTRLPLVAEQVAPEERVLRLDVLDPHTCVELLRRVAPSILAAYPAECRQVAAELEGLPLALHVAAGLLRAECRRGFSIEGLLDELRSAGTGAQRVLRGDVPIDLAGTTTPSVDSLLARSTQVLPDELRERFALLGLFTAKPAVFDARAVTALWNTSEVRVALGELIDRGLIEPASPGAFQIHALLKAHAESLLDA